MTLRRPDYNFNANLDHVRPAPCSIEKVNGLTQATYEANLNSRDELVRATAQFVLDNWATLIRNQGG